MLSVITDFLYPKRCVGCQKLGTFFCLECIKNIKQTELVCPFCERLSIGGVVHAICTRKYGLDGLWSLGIYNGSLRVAIQKLKYRWVSALAETLVDITIEYWALYQPFLLDEIKKSRGKDWLVVPVPLHWQRQNWRGFNQAELFAKIFAGKLGLNYGDCLKRIKNTNPQVGKDSYSRHQNIKGAFISTVPGTPNPNILLIDDVWTTGSTLKECTFILKKAGAKKVWAATIAR